jgi:hypothetical protein
LRRHIEVLTFSELSVDLSAQNVKKIGGSSHVSDLHVTVLVLPFELFWDRGDTRLFIAKL